MLEDLQAEAARIRAGKPTPSDSCGLEDEFGFEGAGGGASSGSSGSRSGSSSSGSGGGGTGAAHKYSDAAAGDNCSALPTDRCGFVFVVTDIEGILLSNVTAGDTSKWTELRGRDHTAWSHIEVHSVLCFTTGGAACQAAPHMC